VNKPDIEAESAQFGSTAAVVLSPLLNLAPASGTGPELRQSRPMLPLGGDAIAGSVMLSLSPDRRSITVQTRLSCAAAVCVRLRRLTGDRPGKFCRSPEDGLLILEIATAGPEGARVFTTTRLSLANRAACLPLAASALEKAGISLVGLRASSIDGVLVQPAATTEFGNGAESGYSAQRMLHEIQAAERSNGAAAASRHVELAILYARQLGRGEVRVS